MKSILVIMGALLVFEGAPWFLSPAGVRKLLSQLGSLPDATLRIFGLFSMLSGLLLVYLATR